MNAKIMMVVTVLVLLFASIVPVAVFAAGAIGDGPDNYLVPGGWNVVKGNERLWFAFNFLYDSKAPDQMIEIVVDSKPDNGAAFTVFTPAEAEHWRKTGELQPIGAGTKNEAVKADLQWAGTFNKSGTYYVVVQKSTLVPDKANFLLTIKGRGVSMPEPLVGPELIAQAPAAAPAVAAVAAPAIVAEGSGPAVAMSPKAEYVALTKAETHWYKVHYDFDGTEEDITVRLAVEPKNSATVLVLTPEQMKLYVRDGAYESCGCTTPDSVKPDAYQSWKGHFDGSGDYYLVVRHSRATEAPAYYKLTVDGKHLSF